MIEGNFLDLKSTIVDVNRPTKFFHSNVRASV